MNPFSYLTSFRFSFCLLLCACGWILSCKNAYSPSARLQVGTARVNITPQLGAYIAGDKINRKFTGVHDSLYAEVAVFYDGNTSLALINVDCIGLLYPDIQKIREQATKELEDIPLPPERIIVASNHIHNGPDVVGIWGPNQRESGVDSAYMHRLISSIAMQVVNAAHSLQPVSAHYNMGMFEGDWILNISEPGELDREITVMNFVDEGGENVLSLTNFACHPTFFDAVHDVVSADYIGGFREYMSKHLPGQHMFLQGAIGGWVQPDKGDQSFELGVQRGKELAEETLRLIGKAAPMVGTELQFRHKVLEVPVTNPGWQQLSQLGVIERDVGETTESEMAWFSIGEAQFVTHPGESPPAYSLLSKTLMGPGPKFVLGLGLDALGYILKPSYFQDSNIPHAEYLRSMSAGPDIGPLVKESLFELIPSPDMPRPSFRHFSMKGSIRAIHAVDAQTLWFGGSGGKYGYTEDGGATWYIDSIQVENRALQFRSIEVLPHAVFLLCVASPALLFKSMDKGKHWELVYQEDHPDCYYNSMAFWDEEEGIAVGDPTDADILSVIITRDGGDSWTKLGPDVLPPIVLGEAGFAASNTNVAVYGDHAWIATGGANARVFHSPDRGNSWEVYDTPIQQGGNMTGIFSIDFLDEKEGFIIGGDWENQASTTQNKAVSHDGGKTWQLVQDGAGPSFRSCVQYMPQAASKEVFAVGSPGISYSPDGGLHWQYISDESFYTLRIPKGEKMAWLAGNNKIAKMHW